MKVEDYYIQKCRGGKVNELPCHHNLEEFLDEWLQASGLVGETTTPLFPTLRHRKLESQLPLAQANVYSMIQPAPWLRAPPPRSPATAFALPASPPTCRTAVSLEVAQQMAGHESARTTGLYDRRNDAVELD